MTDKAANSPVFDLSNDICEDDEKMENGTWVEYGHGIEFLLASQHSRRFNYAVQQFRDVNQMPEKPTYEQSVEADKKYQTEVWGPSIVRGWRTKVNDGAYADFIMWQGKELRWSPEAAGKLATHRLLRTWIATHLAKDDLFRAQQAEAEAKN